jgi:hypothetical protein
MLEEYVDGIELNGIIVVRDGEPELVTLSDRLRPSGIGFGVGWIHLYPSSLDGAVLDRARDVAFAAVRELGLRDGIAFPQLIAAGDDVRLVEIAARIAAGQMADLVRFGTGIELYEIAIAQALGRPVPDELVVSSFSRPVAIRFLTAKPGILPVGTVAAIDGLDEVRASPGVLSAGLYFGPGATITPVQVDADRRGYVVATAETAEGALALADDAARRLVVRTVSELRVSGNIGLLVPVFAAALIAAVAGIALFAFNGTIRPRLVSEAVRARGAMLQVSYTFNEPVRAALLIDGKRATPFSALRRSGRLQWHRMRGNHRIAIEGTDRSGRRAVVSL